MKVTTPEISWHAKEAIYSIDLQAKQPDQPLRLATAGIDANVRIWELSPEVKTGVKFLSNLSRHEKAVNVVRFSKSGKVLASGGDDCAIVLWKLSEKEEAPNIFEEESDIGKNVETWNAFKILRGHLEDINDLSWSADEKNIVSGSIDSTAVVWDVVKGVKLNILNEAKHFIHGVAWDPLGQYVAALSCDRSLRIYSTQTKRVLHNVCKTVYPMPNGALAEEGEEVADAKPQRMFHDESVVRRRLHFTSEGSFLIAPAGSLSRSEGEQINTAYVFSRGCIMKPAAVLPGFKQPVTVIRCCPIRFALRADSENCTTASSVSLPYRMLFAVASSDTLVLYDTQQLSPIALVANIHYAAITDVAWSSDGQYMVVSSRDGFCTIIKFDPGELGTEYQEDGDGQADADALEIPSEEQLCNGTETDDVSVEKDCPIVINDDSGSTGDTVEIEQTPEKGQAIQNGLLIADLSSDSNSLSQSGNIASSREASKDSNGSTREQELGSSCKDTTESTPQSLTGAEDSKTKTQNVKNSEQDRNIGNTTKLPQKGFQESKPRRVQLITLSEGSPVAKSPEPSKPRRVQLTTVSPLPNSGTATPNKQHQTPSSKDASVTETGASPAPNGPKFAAVTPKSKSTNETQGAAKKAPRRIQLTSVDAE